MRYCDLCGKLKDTDILVSINCGTYICHKCILLEAHKIKYTEEYKQQLANSAYIDPVAPPLYQQWVYTDVDNDDIRPIYPDSIDVQIAKKAFEVIELTLDDEICNENG